MPFLLYCLFAGQAPPPPHTPPGVGGGEVEVIGLDGLGAAVSWMEEACAAPPLADLMAYSKVVEVFHGQRTIIPLRYGCLCRDRDQAVALLQAGRGRFKPLLAELEGCVEMGIRAILPVESAEEEACPVPAPPSRRECAAKAKSAEHPGLAYLRARRGSQSQETAGSRAADDLWARCRAALAGMFVRFLREGPARPPSAGGGRARMLSWYFLVPRPEVAAFRQAFMNFSREEKAKLLISGPWPPYSFAAYQGDARR